MRKISDFEVQIREQFNMASADNQPFCILVLEKPTRTMTFLNVGQKATDREVATMVDNLMHNDHCKQSYTFLAVLDTSRTFDEQWILVPTVDSEKQLSERPFFTNTLSRELRDEASTRLAKLPQGHRPVVA